MALTAPEWLTNRGGALRLASDGLSWVVFFADAPQYLLRPIPAAGKHACEIEQLINGRRLESGNSYPIPEDAVRGGLEDLRKTLGW